MDIVPFTFEGTELDFKYRHNKNNWTKAKLQNFIKSNQLILKKAIRFQRITFCLHKKSLF